MSEWCNGLGDSLNFHLKSWILLLTSKSCISMWGVTDSPRWLCIDALWSVAADVLCNSVCPIMTILAVWDWTWMTSYLTLLNTMSTSVVVTFLPSMMWQSLHIFAKFLPFISFPVALVSPWTANFWKEVSTSVIDTVASAILADAQVHMNFWSVYRQTEVTLTPHTAIVIVQL